MADRVADESGEAVEIHPLVGAGGPLSVAVGSRSTRARLTRKRWSLSPTASSATSASSKHRLTEGPVGSSLNLNWTSDDDVSAECLPSSARAYGLDRADCEDAKQHGDEAARAVENQRARLPVDFPAA